MSKVRIVLDKQGVRELLKRDDMKALMGEYAQRIKDTAGDGYEMDTYTGRNRVNASVYADTPHAINSNLKHNTLLKALTQAKKGDRE